MAFIHTQQNWQGMKAIAARFFKAERAEHPDWSVEKLFAFHDIPSTAMLLDLAAKSGFVNQDEPTTEEVCAVMLQRANGVNCAEDIERITKITLPKIQRVLEACGSGYGQVPYGCAPFGNNRAVSNGKSAVSRRITIKGQLSYRGHRYSLGALYRGRVVQIRERERDLLITCKDRSPTYVTRMGS